MNDNKPLTTAINNVVENEVQESQIAIGSTAHIPIRCNHIENEIMGKYRNVYAIGFSLPIWGD